MDSFWDSKVERWDWLGIRNEQTQTALRGVACQLLMIKSKKQMKIDIIIAELVS